jgi:hypothetical protein
MNRELLIDIETYGTKPGSIISQLSMVEINPYNFEVVKFLGPINIDTITCERLGMTMEVECIEWWLQQDKAVQENLLKSPRISIQDALVKMIKFIAEDENPDLSVVPDLESVYFNLWSHSSFDFPIINAALDICHLPRIPFWKGKDMRTVMGMTGVKKDDIEFQGLEHDSMSDVYHEAKLLSLSLKKYKSISDAASSLRS